MMKDQIKIQQAKAQTALEKAETDFKQARARLNAARARINVAERKKDTRRKILLGALLIEEAGLSPETRALVERLILRIERPHDKALFVNWKTGK